MENSETIEEEQSSKKSISVFGIPIIETECQKNAFLYGITGGIVSGLVGFLFTSRPRTATRIAVGSYCTITVGYGCYCIYQEYELRKQIRIIQKTMIEMSPLETVKKNSDDLEDLKFKSA